MVCPEELISNSNFAVFLDSFVPYVFFCLLVPMKGEEGDGEVLDPYLRLTKYHA